MTRDLNLKTTFNSFANLYELIRPGYPDELFKSLIKTTNLKDNSKLLEIGPGTGQATRSLAKKGYSITGVELGEDLATVSRNVLKEYKNVEIITSSFEDVVLPSNSFDLIYSATAFHWIKSELKFSKSYNLLKQGGYLAIIDTKHTSDEQGDEFFFASQAIYKKYKPGGKYVENFRLSHTSELKPDTVDEQLFTPIYFGTFPIKIKYSAKEYAELLNTYSPTISMEKEARDGFLIDIQKLIEDKFKGSIIKQFTMTLTIAKKRE